MNKGGILAVDIGAVVGWAYNSCPGELIPEWGNIRVAARDSDLGEVGLLYFRWLNDMVARYAPRWIANERPFVDPTKMNINTVDRLFGLHAMTATICQRHAISRYSPSTKEVAKFLLGSSQFRSAEKKRKTREIIEQRYGWRPINCDDESDALALYLFAEAKLDPESSRQRSAGPLFPVTTSVPHSPRKRPPAAQGSIL